MNILAASSTLDTKNGYGNITFELIRALRDRGHTITLLLPKDASLTPHTLEGVKVERVLPPYIFRLASRHLFAYLTWQYKTGETFDIVHCLFEFPYAPLMLREARRRRLPFVMGAQGTYGVQPLAQFPERFLMKYVYRRADAIIVPSAYTRDAILAESGESYEISIIHNGVNFERFSSHTLDQTKLPYELVGKFVLLTVGELKNRKGQDLVIRALSDIIKIHPNVMYVMVGYPTWRAHLEALAEELGVRSHILITGPVSDEEVLDYFHRCDLYVHTPRVHARYQFEGFGIVYLEAGACGKAAVGTDSGGIRDALLDGETGLIAPEGDVPKLAKHIRTLIEDSQLRVMYGAAGREYARDHSWKIIASRYDEALQNARYSYSMKYHHE